MKTIRRMDFSKDKYSELFDGTTYNKGNVMAGVVMARGSDLSVVYVSIVELNICQW